MMAVHFLSGRVPTLLTASVLAVLSEKKQSQDAKQQLYHT